MQKRSFLKRFLEPLILALILMISSRMVNVNAFRIDNQALYHATAVVSGTVQFASIVLLAMLVYPMTYFRGATAVERVVAGSTNLALWVGIDTYHVSEAFTCPESIYYGANIGSILFAWSFALMGVLEVACRYAVKRGGGQVRVLTPLPFIPIVVFLCVVYVLSREGGACYFNLLLDGYLALFRT
jgi:hypothetical protein